MSAPHSLRRLMKRKLLAAAAFRWGKWAGSETENASAWQGQWKNYKIKSNSGEKRKRSREPATLAAMNFLCSLTGCWYWICTWINTLVQIEKQQSACVFVSFNLGRIMQMDANIMEWMNENYLLRADCKLKLYILFTNFNDSKISFFIMLNGSFKGIWLACSVPVRACLDTKRIGLIISLKSHRLENSRRFDTINHPLFLITSIPTISSNLKAVRVLLQTKKRHCAIAMWLMHLKSSKDEARSIRAPKSLFRRPPANRLARVLLMPSRSNSQLSRPREKACSPTSSLANRVLLNFIETCVTLTPFRSRRMSEEISIY